MLNVLSLFSGIGAFEKALDNCHIPYNLVNYCEIDKYASKSYSAIHGIPESKNLVDVTTISPFQFEETVDLITYGFPCQDISLAGKQAGFADEDGNKTRSGLFFDAARLIKFLQPKFAIAENVKNLVSKKFKSEFETVLETLSEVNYNNYYAVLNAKHFGIPQNRERVFIVSIRKDIDKGMTFPSPVPLELKLRDMLDTEVDDKYYISEKMTPCICSPGTKSFHHTPDIDLDVARTLLSTMHKSHRAGIDNYVSDVYLTQGIKATIKDGKPVVIVPAKTKKGFTEAYPGDAIYIDRPHQKRGVVQHGLSQTLKCTGNDIAVVVPNETDENDLTAKRLFNIYGERFGTGYAGNVWDTNGLSPTLMTMTGGNRQPLITEEDGYSKMSSGDIRIRKLTPKERFRLMGFDDEDFYKAEAVNSNTQLYKQAGNSIVVKVLEALYKSLGDTYGEFKPT